ncbi:1-acyl-sn-glycerol-3-phosphate acyltransferase [Dokdonella sp.]|uniref:1-acyl-sn-glycerol-3-phosphate acyltransferase n=1 Tax=Dokdonella sp. TaxID=2291710 RepID=UPI0031BF8ACA|nr:1-acyl-sn-glycerol-3-phosphate acyltransferase [Dokdonella sp.]
MNALPLPLPAGVPQFAQNRRRRLVGWLLARRGWHIEGGLPDIARLVLVAAPHSSWWDGVIGLAFKVALGVDIAFMGKRELFRGPLGWLLRKLGGIPVTRGQAQGVVEQMAARFADSPRLWLGLAPEGTRRPVKAWRTGFWHVARAAGVPILPVAFDYPARRIVIGQSFLPAASPATDLARLRDFYAPFRGLRRGVSGL